MILIRSRETVRTLGPVRHVIRWSSAVSLRKDVGFTCSTNISLACQPRLVCGSRAAHTALPCSQSWGRERQGGGKGKLRREEENTKDLTQSFSECGPRAGSSSVTRELVRNTDSQFSPGPTDSKTSGGVQQSVCSQALLRI